MRFCYKRVSTAEQNTDRQLAGMEFDREFVEKISGKASLAKKWGISRAYLYKLATNAA